MHTIQYPSNTYNFQYGLGFQIWETPTGTKIGHTGGLSGVATKMVVKESENIGIIMFVNSAIENLRDRFSFSLIEQLLFLKANQFNRNTYLTGSLFETMGTNRWLSEDFSIND